MRTRPLPLQPLCAGLVALVLLTQAGCSGPKADSDDGAGQKEGTAQPGSPPGTVVLTLAQESSAGIQVGALSALRHRDVVEAWGRVLSVQDLAAARQGLVAAASAAASAKAQEEQSRKEFDRVEGLYAQEATLSQKSLEAARAALETAKASLAAAEASLAAQRSTASQAWGSKVAAELEHGGGRAGDMLALRSAPLLVTPPAEFSGPPPEAAEVAVGESAAGAAFVSVVPRTDGVLQGSGWLYAAGPGAGVLAAGQNVKVLLPSGPERDGVEVPREAGVWWQGLVWVYRQEAPGRFRRTALLNPHLTPGGWFVTEGLHAGDALAVKGAQVLFSEETKAINPGADED